MAGQGCVPVSWEPRVALLPGLATCPASGRRCFWFGWLLCIFFINSLFFLAKICNVLFSKIFVFSLLPMKEPTSSYQLPVFHTEVRSSSFRVDVESRTCPAWGSDSPESPGRWPGPRQAGCAHLGGRGHLPGPVLSSCFSVMGFPATG